MDSARGPGADSINRRLTQFPWSITSIEAESTPEEPAQLAVTLASDIVSRCVALTPDSSVVAVGLESDRRTSKT
jgi:hypothetical protein